MSITLSDHQNDAVKTVVNRIRGVNTPEPLTYIGGVAGSGKSSILSFILEELGVLPTSVAFMAPTGRAAKIMRDKLVAQGYPNSNASTIHSAIYLAKPKPISKLEDDLFDHEQEFQKLSAEGASRDQLAPVARWILRLKKELQGIYADDDMHFQLNEDSIVTTASLIVVDEASMVGKRMAEDLMFFGVPILAMGDPCQLPPVKDDEGLTAGEPHFFLSEIHRQAADNPIIQLSKIAREGGVPKIGDYGQGVRVMPAREYEHDFSAPEQPQWIVGTNKTRWRYTSTLREGFGIDSSIGPQSGEPLVIRKNVPNNPYLVNGTQATCGSAEKMIPGNTTIKMSFKTDSNIEYQHQTVFQGLFEEHTSRKKGDFTSDPRDSYRARKRAIEMDFSYAITCHTAQGGQWDKVVVRDESSVFREDADKWLYTSLTRAAKELTLLV